ncbi:MAG: small multi-drug export protein [Candidatus Aenigmatarchaeota archaeon]
MDAVHALLLAAVPWIELRGAIPVGIAAGLDPILVLAAAIALNVAMFFPIWLFLSALYPRIEKWRPMQWAAFKALKHKSAIDRWGVLGLAIFVAVPLPFTGAYTATLLAWLLRMPWRHAFVAIAVGVIVAGFLVFVASMGVLAGLQALF